MFEAIQNLDAALFKLINGLNTPLFDSFFKFITEFSHFQIPLIFAIVLTLIFGTNRVRVMIVLALCVVACSDLAGAIVKELVGRTRPFWNIEDAHLLVGRSKSPSFPSNHAANIFAAATFISLGCVGKWKRLIPVLFAVAIFVGYSRVYVGVHYPLDVLCGAVIGVACAGSIHWLNLRWPVLKEEAGKYRITYSGLIWVFVLMTTVFRFSLIIQETLPMTGEECQYWDWSRRLDWSYYSKPPMIAWLIKAGTLLFGHTQLAVRGVSLILFLGISGLSAWFVWEITRTPRIVFYTLVLVNIIPLFAVGAIVHTTDTPLMFFWGIGIFVFYRAIFRDQQKFWYIGGIVLGLGLLSKWAMIYLPLCLLIFFLFSKEQRKNLLNPNFYISFLIGMLFFIPVVIWNIKNDWVSFRHVGGNIASSKGFSFAPDSMLEFVGSQFGVCSPIIFGVMIYLIWMFFWKKGPFENTETVESFYKKMPKDFYLFLVWTSLPVFIVIFVKSLLGNVQANWAAPAYYSWTIFTVLFYNQWFETRKALGTQRVLYRWMLAGVILALVMMVMLHEPSILQNKSLFALLKKVGVEQPQKIDPTGRFLDGPKLSRRIDGILEHMPNPDKTMIICDYYQTGAKLAFHMKDNPQVMVINFDERGRMNQYDLWQQPDESFKGWDAIFVSKIHKFKRDDGETPKWQRRHNKMEWSFENREKTKVLLIEKNNVPYHKYAATRCYNFGGVMKGVAKPDRF